LGLPQDRFSSSGIRAGKVSFEEKDSREKEEECKQKEKRYSCVKAGEFMILLSCSANGGNGR